MTEQQAAELIAQTDALGQLAARCAHWLQVCAMLLACCVFFLASRRADR